jgi:hypothetical protein
MGTKDALLWLHQDAMVIGAKLDADVHGEACRLAFYGRMLGQLDGQDPKQLQQLRIYKVWCDCTAGSEG